MQLFDSQRQSCRNFKIKNKSMTQSSRDFRAMTSRSSQTNNVKARSDHHQLKKFIPFMMERSKTGKLISNRQKINKSQPVINKKKKQQKSEVDLVLSENEQKNSLTRILFDNHSLTQPYKISLINDEPIEKDDFNLSKSQNKNWQKKGIKIQNQKKLKTKQNLQCTFKNQERNEYYSYKNKEKVKQPDINAYSPNFEQGKKKLAQDISIKFKIDKNIDYPIRQITDQIDITSAFQKSKQPEFQAYNFQKYVERLHAKPSWNPSLIQLENIYHQKQLELNEQNQYDVSSTFKQKQNQYGYQFNVRPQSLQIPLNLSLGPLSHQEIDSKVKDLKRQYDVWIPNKPTKANKK